MLAPAILLPSIPWPDKVMSCRIRQPRRQKKGALSCGPPQSPPPALALWSSSTAPRLSPPPEPATRGGSCSGSWGGGAGCCLASWHVRASSAHAAPPLSWPHSGPAFCASWLGADERGAAALAPAAGLGPASSSVRQHKESRMQQCCSYGIGHWGHAHTGHAEGEVMCVTARYSYI